MVHLIYDFQMKYSIDTSAILDGWIRSYPPDVFPPLWTKIEEMISNNELKATEEVKEELSKKDDATYQWARALNSFFVPIDTGIQLKVTEILNKFRRLVDTRRNRSTADPFVIALAQMGNATVITGEKPTGNLDKPNIPDVCRYYQIPFISLLDLIRIEGWIFVGINTPTN